MNYVIGVDFDNTIVSYDDILHKVAVERGLIDPPQKKSKKQIRDSIRQLPNGEIEWQRLQAVIYGSRMGEAQLIEGVQNFFQSCRQNKVKAYVVSHKTRYSNLGETKIDLREAALNWMEKNKFLLGNSLIFPKETVYFESTSKEKVERIGELHCTHFIDDLEETFHENFFPPNVEKFLFDPHRLHPSQSEIKTVTHWNEIYQYFFGT